MDNALQSCPIGVFDSGIGGLTVVKELQKILPNENIVYFGDTARLPYGAKSTRLVKQYSIENTIFLNSKNVKMIVIACNTASAASSDFLRDFIRTPVVGVIKCGASVAARITKNKRIGVIGTKSTVRSGAYSKAIKALDQEIKVFEIPTPLLVHLVEENWIEKNITEAILMEYLEPLLENRIDTLILGCTHYPLLKKKIHSLAKGITLVDSSTEIALLVKERLNKLNIRSNLQRTGMTSVFLSDAHPDFPKWSKELLGMDIQATLLDNEQHGVCF